MQVLPFFKKPDDVPEICKDELDGSIVSAVTFLDAEDD